MQAGRALVDALGWTLLHFVWQGAAIAALLATADLLLRRASAHARYLAACGAMVLMLIVAVGSFIRAARLPGGDPVASPAVVAGNRLPAPLAGSVLGTEPMRARLESRAEARRQRSAPLQWDRAAIAGLTRRLMPWLVALWCAGVALLSLRLIGGWWLTRRILARSLEAPLVELDDVLGSLKQRLALSAPVRICRSALVDVPTVIGWMRPVILLPMSTLTGLSPRQIEALLAHELAHIRRHDYLVNLLQSALETLLFYHPAVWWVSRRVREERENCCDDVAVAVCGDAVTYARALAELERLRSETPRLALAATGGSLLARIQRLVGASRLDAAPNWSAGLLAALLAMVLLTGAGLGWGMASPEAPVRLRAFERQARREARHMVARVTEASGRVTLAAATVARVVAIPVVGSLAPLGPTVTVEATSTCETPASGVDSDHAHMSGSCPKERRDAAESDNDSDRAFTDHGVDRTYVKALRAEEFSDDDIVQLHDHGLSLEYVAGMRGPGMPELGADDLVELFSHGVPVEFVRSLTAPGQPERSVEDLVALRSHGVSSDYVHRLESAGYANLSTDELVGLASHGVSTDYALAMKRSGHDEFSAEDLVELSAHGVSSTLVGSLAASGRTDAPVSELVQLGDHGVSAEYVGEIAKSMDDPLPTESIVALHDHGISAEWLSAMIWMGYDDPQRSDLMQLQQNGITPEYVFGFRALGYRDLSPADLIRLRSNGVDPRAVALLRGLGLRDLTVSSMVALRANGVTTDYVSGLRLAGMRPVEANQLIQMRIHGVRAEDVGALVAAGLEPLDASDLVRLRDHGVDGAFVREAVRAGVSELSVDELIRLREVGLRSKESSR